MSASPSFGFLFNHEGTHHVAHAAPVARTLAEHGADITILYTHDALRAEVDRYCPQSPKVKFEKLVLPAVDQAISTVFDKIVPVSRLLTLRRFSGRLAEFDALVVTELTSTRLLKMWDAATRPKLCTLSHGAGDRDVGFDPEFALFDLVMIAGEKQRRRFVDDLKLLRPDQVSEIGYVKFDQVRFGDRKPIRLFDNDNPTVLYNPHFSADYSSWYAWGENVLELFAERPSWNIMVAPHVMLGKRRIHASLISRRVEVRRDFQDRFADCPNIKIDMGSTHSVDMTYTLAADLYLGDMSSQIYEFLLNPRPAVFLNPHQIAWEGNPFFAHWTTGEVVNELANLQGALATAFEAPKAFQDVQKRLFADTFSLTDEPSATRAARALVDFLHR